MIEEKQYFIKNVGEKNVRVLCSFLESIGFEKRGDLFCESITDLVEDGYDVLWLDNRKIATGKEMWFYDLESIGWVEEEGVSCASPDEFLDLFGLCLEDLKDEDVRKVLEVIM